MKDLFKSKRLKLVVTILALLLVGALLAGFNGHGETAQSTVIGTVFAPCHYVASKISSGLSRIGGNVSGKAEYEKEIEDLNNQIGDLQSKLVDYENLKKQNDLYKDFLQLKKDNPNYQFEQASVIGRDSADIFQSFTISKGKVAGVKKGDAVLYGKYLIGVIDKAYPDYSVVKTVLDSSFNVSAYEIVTGDISYVTGNAQLAKDGKCKLANLQSSTKITYGSIVCSAGISGTVPKDLIIGTVDEIRDETMNISSYAVISPGIDINTVTSCFVLTNYESGGN